MIRRRARRWTELDSLLCIVLANSGIATIVDIASGDLLGAAALILSGSCLGVFWRAVR